MKRNKVFDLSFSSSDEEIPTKFCMDKQELGFKKQIIYFSLGDNYSVRNES